MKQSLRNIPQYFIANIYVSVRLDRLKRSSFTSIITCDEGKMKPYRGHLSLPRDIAFATMFCEALSVVAEDPVWLSPSQVLKLNTVDETQTLRDSR